MYLKPHSFFDFPNRFSPVNLDQFYLANKSKIPSVKDPQYIDKCLKKLRFLTYGGYGENRKNVWKGTYLDETQGYIHLGVDINVPNKTEVICPSNAEVIDVFNDTDTRIGWGGRVILRFGKKSPFVILAHLDPRTLPTTKRLTLGDRIGKVGTWPTNGNTFEHLHLQLRVKDDFENMDGYGTETDLFINPCPFTTQL